MYQMLPDKVEAVRCYLMAIDLENDIEAFNCLALIYESGICIDVLTPSKIEPL